MLSRKKTMRAEEFPPLPQLPTYVGFCCREWILVYGFSGTTCGYCGERPTYLRENDAPSEG